MCLCFENHLAHGTDLSGSEGVIESPLYPRVSTALGDFFWTVSVNDSNRIEIIFEDLEMYDSSSSCWNKLIIYDGADGYAPVLFDYCTSNIQPVTSTGNVVHILLSKQEWTFMFQLRWREVALNEMSQFITDIHGKILSV